VEALSTAELEDMVRQEVDEIRATTPACDTEGSLADGEIEVPVLPDVDGLSVAEIEELVALDAGVTGVTRDDSEEMESVSIDEALRMLADGEGERIEPWLDTLMQRLLPLLELYDSRRAQPLGSMLEEVRARVRRHH
jgi:hypothetical protein